MIASLLINEGSKLLKEHSENPHQESCDFLSHILKISRDQLRLCSNKINLNESQIKLFFSYLSRRSLHEPLAYILNQEFFWEQKFYVDKRVLIPRPESEFLIEHLFKNISKPQKVLDLCCGSGVLGITSSMYFKNKLTILSDISYKALEVSQINSKKFKTHTSLIQTNLLNAFKNNSFDLILCNPPYVTKEHKKIMTKDVLNYEPHLALFSENKGLTHIFKIIQSATIILKESGKIYIEIGIHQLKDIQKFILNKRFKLINIINDFQNIPRILLLEKTNE
ncbi:MAG: protein-(glutamine-N5) methyltransferase, release factor-specific [Candidatus Cloacimonadota bacterium]|nr:MAG: protein-(glutamine-N5) methyltransferase, release factor-specific [Candidatus Cloacimonadota bacterium]